MSVSNRNSGIHAGVTQAHEKCAMKIKRRKEKQLLHKIFLMTALNFFDDRKDCVWLYQKSDVNDFDELPI